MLLKIHDLPVKNPMEGMSFHVTDDPIDRIWWDGVTLDIVTVVGDVWSFDFKADRWVRQRNVQGRVTYDPELQGA